MARAKVYLETTIVSYLTAWPSRDLIMAGHQQITHDWWDTRRQLYDLYVSQLVLTEAADGDPDAAARRLTALRGIPIVAPTPDVNRLARTLLAEVPLPPRAEADAIHLAIAVLSGIEYLLTWNCKHLANAALFDRIESVCAKFGFMPPKICTPELLLEDSQDDQ